MILGPNGQPVSSQRALRGHASEHAFDAAKRSGYRGWFYFPHLDPAMQMPQWTREETARKVNWLYNNVGAVTAAIDGVSLDEVDTGIWPKATTSHEAFNTRVTDDFDNECGDPRFFDEAAGETYYSAQWLIRRSIALHGDIFGQMLRPGESSAGTSIHFLPMWQCANAATKLDQSAWQDGVRRNRMGRPLQYRFLTSGDRTSFVDVSADDVLHFHDKFWTGQTRGISGLAPVVRKLFSIDDIERAETSGTLLRTRLAYAITKEDDEGGGPRHRLPGVADTETVTNEDGSKLVIQKIISRDGSEVDVADLPAGFDIKVVESSRGTMGAELVKFLLTDVALARGYPPEYMFFLAGLTQGTAVRAMQNRVQRVVNTVRQFQLIPQFCRRWYLFWLWQRIKRGVYDDVGVPEDWYKHKHICPADMTVDLGREGRLYDERVASGKLSPERYHGMQGEDAGDVEDEIIAARVRRERKLAKAREENPDIAEALAHDAVFRPPAGSQPAAQAGGGGQDGRTKQDDKEEEDGEDV